VKLETESSPSPSLKSKYPLINTLKHLLNILLQQTKKVKKKQKGDKNIDDEIIDDESGLSTSHILYNIISKGSEKPIEESKEEEKKLKKNENAYKKIFERCGGINILNDLYKEYDKLHHSEENTSKSLLNNKDKEIMKYTALSLSRLYKGCYPTTEECLFVPLIYGMKKEKVINNDENKKDEIKIKEEDKDIKKMDIDKLNENQD
jgi:hypothetical protein